MEQLITHSFSTLVGRQFIELMNLAANTYLPLNKRSFMYVVLGRQLPWDNEQSPPTPEQSVMDLVSYHDSGIVARRLSLDSVSFVVPRVNWESGTVYAEFGCMTCPAGTPFYILNSVDQVFKCLDNNGAVGSTDEPQLVLSATSLEEPYFLTSDGYKWKYLYTLSSNQKQKFLNRDWMPVDYNRFVRATAVNRSIDIVKIENGGNNYVDGSVQGIITVEGDGQNAVLKANVIDGHVTDIIIQNRGENYTRANLIFTDVTGGIGTQASATIVLGPQNGHGYDPVEELYANTVMFNVDFTESEEGVFPAENEFRQVHLLHNPYVYGTTTLASGDIYKLYTQIRVSPGVGDFNNDERVVQDNFSADVISFDETTNTLFLNNLIGTFTSNQPIKGLTSGAIRVGLNLIPPTLEPYSGKVLYVTNKAAVVRDPDQTERVRFILSF